MDESKAMTAYIGSFKETFLKDKAIFSCDIGIHYTAAWNSVNGDSSMD